MTDWSETTQEVAAFGVHVAVDGVQLPLVNVSKVLADSGLTTSTEQV